MKKRKIEELIFNIIMRVSAFIIFGSLIAISATILIKGVPAMNLDMITKTPSGGFFLGKEGGILNAIIGSFYLSVGATIFALMICIPVVIYINVYASENSKIVHYTRLSLDILYGIPSIVFGAFGFVLMLFLGMHVSLLAGMITVGLLIIPIIARTMDEVMRQVPVELKEASYSLGATKWETASKVLLKQALPGLATASLLGLGRAIGDAASVMFTTGFTDNIPHSLQDPAATLPLAIFFQLSSPIAEVRDRAYAAALILTVIIFAISLISRILIKRFSKNTL
ncbi:MAG TPA: phosphate ABC transporter permease PstA [Chitinophagales bacterium]|nr:phosphate ABC transporter permease PstA [Chitinophagales bacterium]HNA57178.1 phosphate ABC transporter permease PstA [Chitinophagales bacterium]HNF67927.1 phosphate ABC transporter permease PstA [Chitinophagales bacterium]HNI53637.1 phosphate ABC transporter permease PstA [Chitinophagales bacterium]HNJ88552.1 phosphate ABC transporter permease PstA [Chitinophagales bacterium]